MHDIFTFLNIMIHGKKQQNSQRSNVAHVYLATTKVMFHLEVWLHNKFKRINLAIMFFSPQTFIDLLINEIQVLSIIYWLFTCITSVLVQKLKILYSLFCNFNLVLLVCFNCTFYNFSSWSLWFWLLGTWHVLFSGCSSVFYWYLR